MASLAIGIGATAAVLNLAMALLGSGAPGVAEPQRLAGVYTATAPDRPLGGTSYLNFLDLRESRRSFQDLATYYRGSLSWSRGGEAEPVQAEAVSGNYFTVLGVSPEAGRLLGPGDDRGTTAPVAVVSSVFWKKRLGRDRDFGPLDLVLNGTSFTIVGVATSGFRGPSLQGETEVWIPLAMLPRVASGPMPRDILQDRGAQWFSVVGRLAPGQSASHAQADLEALRSRLAREHGTAAWGRSITVTDWREVALGSSEEGSRKLLSLLALCSAVILLLACLNAAHLLTGRALSRQSEAAIRLVLGASRERAFLAFAGECLLLGLSAFAGGLAVRHALLRLLLHLEIPLTDLDVRLTLGHAISALVIALVSVVIFSSPPLFVLSRTVLAGALRNGGPVAAGTRRFRPGKVLVLLEAGFATTLLIAAFLVLASAWKVLSIDPGFDPGPVAVALVDLSAEPISPEQASNFYVELLERVRGEPGVSSASLVSFLPFEGSLSWAVYQPGRDLGDATPQFRLDVVDAGSFAALGIPLLRGRDFVASDANGGAVIVSSALARTLWPGEEALGQTISLDATRTELLPVVGVVGDARYESLTEPPHPHFYLYRGYPDRAGLTAAFSTNFFLVVRAHDSPYAILPRLRQIIREIDPHLPISRLEALEQPIQSLTARSRYTAILIGLLAGIGLLLAAGGVYGVMLSSLSARRSEIALRIAVGAVPAAIVRMAMREAILLTAGGIVAGAALALALSRLLEKQLYEISSREPLAFLSAAAVLLAAGWMGSHLPARRAARRDAASLLKDLGR